MNRRERAARRVKQSKIPVNPTLRPSQNAPAWVGTIAGFAAGLVAQWAGVENDPVLVQALGTVIGLVLGVVAQRFTTPVTEIPDHDAAA